MKTTKTLKATIVFFFLGALLALPFTASNQQTIEIQVSPHVLNIANNGQVVTVHTDIAYSLVVGQTVTMNGIEISSWKADDRGYFVAKFVMEEIVNLPLNIGDYNTLTLEGEMTTGDTFIGSEDILVINVSAKGKN